MIDELAVDELVEEFMAIAEDEYDDEVVGAAIFSIQYGWLKAHNPQYADQYATFVTNLTFGRSRIKSRRLSRFSFPKTLRLTLTNPRRAQEEM